MTTTLIVAAIVLAFALALYLFADALLTIFAIGLAVLLLVLGKHPDEPDRNG